MLGTPLGRILLDKVGWTYLLGPFFKASTPDAAAPLSATYREAGAVGALTVTDTGNRLTTSAGALQVATGGSGGDPGYVNATGHARTAGRTCLFTVNAPGTANVVAGWAAAASPANLIGQVGFAVGVYVVWVQGTGIALSSVTPAVDYQFAVVLRGTGYHFLAKLATAAQYTLLYVGNAGAQATLYPAYAQNGGTGAYLLRNYRVADLGGAWASDYGIALARSTFTAADSTNLTAITPEVGETWTVRSGTWAIQSNKAQRTSTGNHEYAVIDARASDYLVECTIVTAVSNPSCGLVVRESDASGYWLVAMAGGVVTLYEYDGAAFTSRASGGSITTNTSYRVVVICAGSTITAYVNNVQVCTYASATRNQTATFCGIRAHGINDTTSTFDDFIAWPRTVALPTGV